MLEKARGGGTIWKQHRFNKVLGNLLDEGVSFFVQNIANVCQASFLALPVAVGIKDGKFK